MSIGLALLAVLAVSGCGSTDKARTGAARRPTGVALDSIVLRPAQIGRAYRLRMRTDSRGVAGYVTLDLCRSHFASEALRTARLQVNYTGGPVKLSNEVVRYRGGGAQQALQEARSAARNCPHTPVASPVAGVGPLTYRIRWLHDKDLPPRALALRVHVTGRVHGRRTSSTDTVVYQAHANLLSGVYGAGGGRKQQRVALHAAAASGRNLSTAH